MRKLKLIFDEKTAFHTLEYVMKNSLGLTKRQISQAKFGERGICVNGKRQRISYIGQPGDLLTVSLEERLKDTGKVVPKQGDLEILYEDQDILAVNKPAGIPCHPGRGHYQDSLGNLAAGLFEKRGEPCPVRIIGRLDKDTSGVVLLAKNQAAGARLGEQKGRGVFQKEYLGMVQGHLKKTVGRIREPIGKIPGEKLKMQIDRNGKSTDTEYRILDFLEDNTVMAWKIFTGRTHQIRVHMAWLGYPLLGDSLYGDGENPYFSGLALHCRKAVFCQPFTGEKIEVLAPARHWREALRMGKFLDPEGNLTGSRQEL
ncbi:MAG TPA: RluA family pseudouridine synthase [Candidatus Blautia merdigallinarum]|uniref:Pseudouridine synthase n=2 Tax=Lachnospiraceae TaxID=186803 RepID=A0A9D2N4J7_9FIRM|nr:RluA family pseudouridine synthase [Candidatus Blautia merdigallinarum]